VIGDLVTHDYSSKLAYTLFFHALGW
jgi:hypothetical protein